MIGVDGSQPSLMGLELNGIQTRIMLKLWEVELELYLVKTLLNQLQIKP